MKSGLAPDTGRDPADGLGEDEFSPRFLVVFAPTLAPYFLYVVAFVRRHISWPGQVFRAVGIALTVASGRTVPTTGVQRTSTKGPSSVTSILEAHALAIRKLSLV